MYNPHNWVSEEIITADKLNNLETGVQDTEKKIETKQDKLGYTPADDSKVVHTKDMRKPASDVAGIEEVNAKADTSAIDPSVMTKQVLTADDDVLALDPGTYYTYGKSPKNYPTSVIPWGVVVVKNISQDGNNRLVEAFDTYTKHFVNIRQGNTAKWSGWQVPNSGTLASKSDVTTAISAATANKVNTSDTANWQKTKVTSDDGSPLISLTSSNQDLSATLLNLGVGLRTVYAGNSVQNNPFSGVSSAKGVVDIQGHPSDSGAFGEGFLIGTKPNQEIIMYHVWVIGSKVTYTQIANDSAVVHNSGNEEIGGQKTFDTAPIDKTTGNPYITKSDLPSDNNTVVKVVTQAQYDALTDKTGLYVVQG